MSGKDYNQDNRDCLEEKFKLAKSSDSSNLIEWFLNLQLYLKSKVDAYSEVIELRKVPEEWLIKYEPTEAEEEAIGNSKIKFEIMKDRMRDSSKLVEGWKKAKFIISSFIERSISSKSITLIEDKFRTDWMIAKSTNDVVQLLAIAETAHLLSGKVSTQRDKEAARKRRFDLSMQKSKTLDNFIKDIQEVDKLIISVGLTDIAEISLKQHFIDNMSSHSSSIIRHEAVRDAMAIEDIGFPTLPELFIKYQKLIAYSTKEDKLPISNKFSINNADAKATNNSKTPDIITFADGSTGYETSPDTYEVFMFDKSGKASGTKKFKGKKNKYGKISLKPYNNDNKPNHDKSLSITTTERVIGKIMVKKGIDRDAARKELTCKKCKKIGHLQED
jgi:hypothetical protein